jgi:hypothetical protein
MEFRNIYPTDHARGAYEATIRYPDPFSPASLPYLSFSPSFSQSYAADEDAALSHLDAITDSITTGASKDPLAPFFHGQKAFAAKTVEDILGLVYEREQLKTANLRCIDYDSCYLKTRLFEIDSWRTGIDPQLDKTRGSIERDLLGLEREKRFEEVACWRDTTRLRTDLREALKEFQQEKNKESLLSPCEVKP